MDIPSNDCFAWFCRSTCPFQTFLVSNIGLLWLVTAKHVTFLVTQVGTPYPFQLQAVQPRSGIEKGENHPVGCHAFACPTHTYHRYWLNVESCGRLVPQSTRSLLLISPHMHSRQFNYLPLYQTTPAGNLVEFLVFSAERSSENPYHLGEISTSRKVATCLLFIYLHRGPFPPPYMGSSVGVLCTGYRQLLTVLVAFLVLVCFSNSSDQYQKFNSLLRSSQKWPLSGIEPATIFSPGFRLRRAAIPSGNTGVSHLLNSSSFYETCSLFLKLSALFICYLFMNLSQNFNPYMLLTL